MTVVGDPAGAAASLLKDAGRYAVARGLPGVVNFLALSVYTRLLGREAFGRYALVLATVGLLYAIGYQWLSLGVLRLRSSRHGSPSALQRVAGRVFAGLSLFSAIGLTAILLWHRASWLLVAGACLLMLAQAWLELNLVLATAGQRPDRYALLSGLRAVCGLALGSFLAARYRTAEAPVFGVALGSLTAGVWAFASGWTAVGDREGSPEIQRQLLIYGMPLAVAAGLDYVVSTSDRLLVGGFLGAGTAGLYSAAYDLCQQSMWTLLMIINLAAYPAAVQTLERGEPGIQRAQFGRHITMLVAVGVPVAAALAVLAPSIGATIVGPQFSATASQLLPILGPALLIGGLKAFYFDLSFQLGKRTDLQAWSIGAAAATNLVLNLWWIPRFGYLGAGYATLVAYALGLVMSVVLGRRAVRMAVPWRALARVGGATAGMIAVLLAVRDWPGLIGLVGQSVVGAGAYITLGLAFNVAEVRQHAFGR